jgi:hypothetical protein
MKGGRVRRLVQSWYLATPLFVALDLGFGLNVRVVFADQSALRFLWYALLAGCALVTLSRPGLTAAVGMVESGISVALLIIGIYLPVLGAAEALEAGTRISPILTPRGLVNAALSGGVFVVSFYGNQAALIASRRR